MITVDGYALDLSISEGHEHPCDATEFPVEEGPDVTDHVRAKPIEITLEGIISDTPLAAIRSRRISDGDMLEGDDATPFIGSPAKSGYTRLRAIRDARKPVTVVTSLDSYDNMVITNLSVPRDSGEPDCLHFTVTFQQIDFKTNRRAVVKVAAPGLNGGQNRGSKVPTGLVDSKGNALFQTGTLTKNKDGTYRGGLRDINGKPVSAEDADAAVRRNGAVPIVYDRNGNTIPPPANSKDRYDYKSDPNSWYNQNRNGGSTTPSGDILRPSDFVMPASSGTDFNGDPIN